MFTFYFLCFFYSQCMQGSANQYKGICDCVSTIVREEGIPTLVKVWIHQVIKLFRNCVVGLE